MAEVSREKEMAVSRDCLFEAITDFTAYPDFLTEVVGAEIESQNSTDSPRVKFELDLVKRFQYVLQFQIEGKESVSWELVESNIFKMNTGSWHLKPVGDQLTFVDYRLEVSFPFLVPKWITKKLTEINLPRMFDAFETRAVKLAENN